MAAPKRTKTEREHDLERVSRLYLDGKSQLEIAALLGVSRQQIGYDLKILHARWLESSMVNFQTVRAKELAKIDNLERIYLEAWARSCEDKQVTSTEKRSGSDTDRNKAAIRKEQRDGDPRFLWGVQWCIDQRMKLLLPKKVETHANVEDIKGRLEALMEQEDFRRLLRESESWQPPSLAIAKPEGGGKKLVELIMEPSLNVRGLRSAYVGEQAQNVVPEKAEASLEARLVKGEDPKQKFEQIVAFIGKKGFFIVDHEPTTDERRSHARIAKVIYEGGYRASRTPMDLPMSKAIVEVVRGAAGHDTVIMPSSGGSVPMYIFEDLGLQWVGVPIVNYDNHQHSSDENLRLGQFWRGMEIYGAILSDLNW